MNDNKMITQSRIIEEYGWTKSLISKFLPDPVLKANPHYRKAAPMRLWDEDTVKQVMTTSEFQDSMEKANKRKKSASKAVETKYSNMNHSVQLFIDSITIKVLSDEELKTKALKAKQEWYQCHPCSLNGDWIDEPYMKNAYTADEETINRWIVNYIRHNLVSYDNFLGSIDGKVGSVEAYPEVKIAVLEKLLIHIRNIRMNVRDRYFLLISMRIDKRRINSYE